MPQPTNKNASIRKRQKIQQSNKTMFVWIAAMSAVVGVCLVVSWFLYQQLVFKTRVINHKRDTLSALERNVDNADEVIANVRKHEADSGLNSAKANDSDRALQVILDALPTNDNKYALGSSIQKRLAGNLNGVSIESLTVGERGSSSSEGSGVIPFTLVTASNSPSRLQELLVRFERSIRTIKVVDVSLERPSDNKYSLSIQAEAYYEPPTTIELGEETITP